jgi:hypothetical protein
MVEINLLPWREYARMRLQARRKVFMSAMVILMCFLSGIYLYFSHVHQKILPVHTVPVVRDNLLLQLQKIKFIGYFQQHHHISAIILLPDGKTRAVENGSQVIGKSRIASITPSAILIVYPYAKLKISRSHT